MQRKAKDNPDKTYQSFSFGQDKNTIVYELDRIKHGFQHKHRGQKKITVKDIAIRLLALTRDIGQMEVSQQAQAAETHPDLDVRPNHQEGGLELVDLYGAFKWPVRISQRLLQQFKTLKEDETVGYLTLIRMLCDGRWPGPSNRETCMRVTAVPFGVAIEHGGFFLINVPDYRDCDLRLLFSVGVERIPLSGEYQYRHYLKFWLAFEGVEPNELAMEQVVRKCWEQISIDCALNGFEAQLRPVPRKGSSEKTDFSTKRKFEMNIINQVQPLSFASTKLQERLIFDRGSNRWTEPARMRQIEAQKEREAATQLNQDIIRKVVDFKSVQQLIGTMSKIPGFRIKCSEEEKKVIGHDGSLIVMGRSGTGKTTCAVLRLFTVQMLFHIRQHLGKDEIQLRDTRPGVDKPIGLHSIFATASPCLAREIERYYKEFAYEVKKQTAKKKGNTFEEQAPGAQERSKAYVDISAIRNEMFKIRSMEELAEENYPAFMTTRELLFLVDGALEVPFFDSRPSEESVDAKYGRNQTAVRINRIEEKLNIAGNNVRQKQPNEHKPEQVFYAEETHQSAFKKKMKLEQNDYFEVTYESFAMHFWPQVRHTPQGKQLTPEMVWTQILSNIKGSTSSYLNPNYAEPKEVYLERSKHSLLSERQREAVYEVHHLYEQWKLQVRAYDLMDAVNYILSRVLRNGYNGPPIHFLMIDEVQDLPYVFILLLTLLVETGMFFSGDSAQTIAKGVEFRFSEIRRMFNKKFAERQFKLEPPTLMQLSINFRSHNAILQLSNSVVSMIEVLFPSSIDRLRKERSDYDGPKPTVLSGEDAMDQVLAFMENKTDFQDYSTKQPGGQKRSKLEFGFYKAILVRDSESKKKMPQILREEYLCLTVQEAKGLQFYDVLIYNFFDDSPVADQWKILRWIKVHSYNMRRQEFEDMFSKFSEENEKVAETDASHSIEGDTVVLNKLCQETRLTKEELCEVRELSSQLKLLYTAVTRARNNLMIYDEVGENRKPIEKIWQRLEVLWSEKDLQKKTEPVVEKPQQQISKEQWREQGMVMLNRNLLQEAIKCFKKSGDYDLYTKAQAKSLADQAAQEMAEANAELGQLETSNIFARLSRNERKERTKQLNLAKATAAGKFRQAARKYEEVKEYQDAGRCFFSIGQSQAALDCFRRSGDIKSMAHCYFELQQYMEASIRFLEGDYFMDCLESLDLAQQYEPALGVIHKFHKQMTEADKLNLLDYFLRKALGKLGESYMTYEAKEGAKADLEQIVSMESLTISQIGSNDLNQINSIRSFDDINKQILDTRPQIEMTQEELQQEQLQKQLVELLEDKGIKIGRFAYRPERTHLRIINMIALLSRHVELEERDGWTSTERILYPQDHREEDERYNTNEEIALGELEFYDQILLCLVMCRNEKTLYRRLPYYGLSWIYQVISLPKVSNALLQDNSVERKNALVRLDSITNSIHGVLSRISDEFAESIDEVSRSYYVQGLILLGLHRQAISLVEIPGIFEICYTHFDLEELSRIFTEFLNEDEREYYSKIDSKGESLITLMKIERLLWRVSDIFGLQKSLVKCSFNASLNYQLPPEMRYGQIYNKDVELLTEKEWQDNVSSCIQLLYKMVYDRERFPSSQVYDVTVFSLFVLHYASTKEKVLNSIDTATFLKMQSCLQRIANNLLRHDERNPNAWNLMQATLSFYRLRTTRRDRPSDIHQLLGDDCLYMHTSSPLLPQVLKEQEQLAAQKKDNFTEHLFFVDTYLSIMAVPLESTLNHVKASIIGQLKKSSNTFCSLPGLPVCSYEDHLSNEYKVILRHYMKQVNDEKFQKEQLYRLLPFNKNEDMPPLLRNHLLRFSRQIRKRKRYSPTQRYNECAALIISGQVSIYREIYIPDRRCSLYELLNEKLYNDFDLFDELFEKFTKDRGLSSHQILPMYEELMLVLMEKYILLCENFLIYKLRLFDSQLAFFKDIKWSKQHGYTYEDHYIVQENFNQIKAHILQYFEWLARQLNWKFHGLLEPQLQRIRNLVFIFMININFGSHITYGYALFAKHMRILENCQIDVYVLKKIRELVQKKGFGSSNELTQLLAECSTERIHIVEFKDVSSYKKNLEMYHKDLDSLKKKEKERSQAACVIQKWWLAQRFRINLVKQEKGKKPVLDDEWKANAFYSMRRAVPFPDGDFLKRVSSNCNEVAAVLRQTLQENGGRSSHIFHSAAVELRRLGKLRNSFSDLAQKRFPKKQLEYDQLYEQLEEIEESIDEFLVKANKPRAEQRRQQIPLHNKHQQIKWQS